MIIAKWIHWFLGLCYNGVLHYQYMDSFICTTVSHVLALVCIICYIRTLYQTLLLSLFLQVDVVVAMLFQPWGWMKPAGGCELTIQSSLYFLHRTLWNVVNILKVTVYPNTLFPLPHPHPQKLKVFSKFINMYCYFYSENLANLVIKRIELF